MENTDRNDQLKRLVVTLGAAIVGALVVGALILGYIVVELHSTAVHEHKQRIVTVTQRCELTDHDRKVLEHQDPAEAVWYQGSYARCEKQLKDLRRAPVPEL